MVNYKTVYFNAENSSFPLGLILGYKYSRQNRHSRRNVGSFGEVSARLLFFLNLGEILARSWQSRLDVWVFQNLGKISPRSYRDLLSFEQHGEILAISVRSWQSRPDVENLAEF